MAIVLDVTSVQFNDRGVYFEFVGDNSATVVTVPHGQYMRGNMTVSATAVTAPTTNNTTDSNGGGLITHAGTNAAITSAVISGANVVVTTTAAVANATRCYVNVVFTNTYTD